MNITITVVTALGGFRGQIALGRNGRDMLDREATRGGAWQVVWEGEVHEEYKDAEDEAYDRVRTRLGDLFK